MKLRKIAGIAAASMLLLTGCANAGGEREALTSGVNEEAKAALPEDIRNAGVLKVAVDYPYPPFAHEDVDTGEMQRLEVDLAELAAQPRPALGRRPSRSMSVAREESGIEPETPGRSL